RYNGGNNGRLTLSLEEAAAKLHVGKATVFAAFAETGRKRLRRMHQARTLVRAPGLRMGRYGQGRRWRNALLRLEALAGGDQPVGSEIDRKTERGSVTDPSGGATGRTENRRLREGSATEPVEASFRAVIGSKTDR